MQKSSDLEGDLNTMQYCFQGLIIALPWRRQWEPTPVFLPGEPRGWRSLADYSHGVTRVGHN